MQASLCNFTKSNNPPLVFLTFLKFYKWYQIRKASHILLLSHPGPNTVVFHVGGRFWAQKNRCPKN